MFTRDYPTTIVINQQVLYHYLSKRNLFLRSQYRMLRNTKYPLSLD